MYDLVKQAMITKAQLRRGLIHEMGADPMFDVNRPDVEVRGGTVFVIEQVENYDFRGVRDIKGGFFASLELKNRLGAMRVAWRMTQQLGKSEQDALKASPK